MTTRKPVRFSIPILVFLSLAVADSNAVHCELAPHPPEPVNIMVEVFPCDHDEKGRFKYLENEEDREKNSTYNAAPIPAAVKTSKTDTGATDVDNLGYNDAKDGFTVKEHNCEDRGQPHGADPERCGDAREEWSQVDNQLFNRFPDGTVVEDDGTVLFPKPKGTGRANWCMYNDGDIDNKYPQPLKIDGHTGAITLMYHHNNQTITFPGVDPDTATTMEGKEEVVARVKTGNSIQLECVNLKIFGRCIDKTLEVNIFGKTLGGTLGGHKLVLNHTSGPFPILDFTPAGPVGSRGLTRNKWIMLSVEDPSRARMRLKADPVFEKLLDPAWPCYHRGSEEYWTMDCKGEAIETKTVQHREKACPPPA